jgi:hypothetical protein
MSVQKVAGEGDGFLLDYKASRQLEVIRLDAFNSIAGGDSLRETLFEKTQLLS